jgi:Skp family chaperone for outer membrane proteins
MKTTILVTLFFSCISGAVGFYAGSEINPATIRVYSLPTPAPAPKETLRIGIVDLNRLFEAHPRTPIIRAEMQSKIASAKAEMMRLADTGDREATNEFRNKHNEELNAESKRLRLEIVSELEARATNTAKSRNLDLLLDSSGKDTKDVKFVLDASGVIDVTDQMLRELK